MTQVPQKEVTETQPGLFTSRLKSKEVVHSGVMFKLQALPALLSNYLIGDSTKPDGVVNRGLLIAQYLKFGIVDIQLLTDEKGKPIEFKPNQVRIMEHDYDVAPTWILNGIHPDVLTSLYLDIDRLTHLTEVERRKLDFTSPSENEGSTETTGEDKQ